MLISLEEAIDRLDRGQLIAIATETVYGLAARLDRPRAIEEIFLRKKRPRGNPLIIHLENFEQITSCVLPSFSQMQELESLNRAFWPGPLTVVLPVDTNVIPTAVRADLPTAAFRIPAHPLTRLLLQKTGPLVAPSANLSGRPSPTRPNHVEVDFGSSFPILGGDYCLSGLESTIVGWNENRLTLMRLGATTISALEKVVKQPIKEIGDDKISRCPGRRSIHYSPQAQLTSDLTQIPFVDAVVGFEDRKYPNDRPIRLFSLGSAQDDARAAHQLFAVLRSLDDKKIKRAFVDLDLPKWGLWPAICDRLTRAIDGQQKSL